MLSPKVDDPGSDRLSTGGVHFTIGSAAGHDSAETLDLREDLALVKASLLYADRVKLCSLGASVLSGIAQFQEASTEEQARLVVGFLPDLAPSMSSREIHFFEAALGLRGREEKQRISKRTRREILSMVSEKEGELEVHPFRHTPAQSLIEATIRGGGNPLYGLDLVDLLKEFLDQVKSAVEGGFTYPMFDDLTGNFVAEAIRSGLIRSSEASIA